MTEKNQFIEDLYIYFPDDWKILFKDYEQTKKLSPMSPVNYLLMHMNLLESILLTNFFLMKTNNQFPPIKICCRLKYNS